MKIREVEMFVCARKFVRAAAIMACAILLFGAGLSAQQVTGRITGTVVDSTGGAVPNAQITITNQDTGVVRNAVAGADGLYNVPQLQSGKYTVEVSAEGFGREEVKDVAVSVATDTRVDLKLTVGSLTQSVTVSEAAPLIDTTSSSLGGTVDEHRIVDLPINGRNWDQLTLMQAGITQAKIAAFTGAPGAASLPGVTGTAFSSNGATLRSNLVTLDGANMTTLSGFNADSMTNTTLGTEGIKEYKVVTSNFSAEYGLRMGAQTTIVSKGGTNQFHGTAFEYLRNSALDAADFFVPLDTANVNGFGTNKSQAFPGKRLPPFERNNFGAAFGGPIQKDKTFFWADYEGLRERRGAAVTTYTLPAACFLNAAGTINTGPNGPQVPAVIQNTAGACVPGGAAPLTVTNAAALTYAQLYPYPNVNNAAYKFNFTYPYIQPTGENYGQIRVDRVFSSSDTAFLRYTADVADTTPVILFPGFVNPLHSTTNFVTLGEDHIFSPTLLNTARLSFSESIGYNNPTSSNPALNTSQYSLVTGQIFPAISPGTGPGSITIGGIGTSGSVTSAFQYIYTLADDVFWTKGKHALKFGILINHFLQYPDSHFNFQGSVSFTTLQNYFDGDYSSFVVTQPGSQTGLQLVDNTFGFYAQDDYRMSTRITLNMGLRYEFSTVPREMVPSLRSVVRSPLDNTGTPGPYFLNNSLHNLSPRLGFAWDLFGNGKTVLKGGAGIYYDLEAIQNTLGVMGISNPPVSQGYQINNSVNVTLPATLPAFQIPFVFPAPHSVTTAVISPRAPEFNLQQPTLGQWSLTVEHEFPWAMGLSVSYIGSRAWHLMQLREDNPTVSVGFAPNGLPQQCGVALVAGLCNSATLPGRLNNTWGSFQVNQARGDSYFHSLQVQLNKRVTQGLQFQFTYTYSKLLDTGQGQLSSESATEANQFANNVAESQDKGPASFDDKHNVRANFIYHVPTFKTSNMFAGKLLNGWWVSSIIAVQSGYPFSPSISTDRALTGSTYRTLRPNLDPTYNPATVVTGNINAWFNPTMFDAPPTGQYGNAGRNFLRGPGFTSADFSLVKDTKVGFLGEAGSVQFRMEVFNVLNHPAFGLPNSTVSNIPVGTLPAGGQILPAGTFCTTALIASGQCVAGSTNTTVSPLATGATAGSIGSTISNSRQIQFALKLIF